MNKRQITLAAIASFIISGLLFLVAFLFYISNQTAALIYSVIIALAFSGAGLFILKGESIIQKASHDAPEHKNPVKKRD